MKGSGIREGWGLAVALGLLAAMASSCVGANADHCVYAGGDLACGTEICVLAPRGGTAPGAGDDGCFDGSEPPTGFIHAEFGLPARLEAEGDPMDVTSVEGLLRRLAEGERSVSASDLAPFRGAVFEDVQQIRGLFTREGGVSEGKRELSSTEEEQAIETYYDAIRAWLEQQPPGTGTVTESGTTDTGGTQTSTGETSEPECMMDGECTDATKPFCGATEECVTCEQMPDPDGACAGRDAGLPLCVGGACVACTAESPEVCRGMTPVCDDATNMCVGCSAHEQCGEAACNLFTGACLPAEAVVHVGPLQEYATLGEAIESFAEEGAQGTIVVHQANYDEAATVDGGRVLAFLASDGAVPRWILGGGGSPQLTVTGDATVLLDGVQVSGNASDVGLQVNGARAWVDRGRLVQNAGGGVVAENGTELVLRNCFVGQDTSSQVSIAVDGANATILYTTALGGFGMGTRALQCMGSSAIEVRNSVFATLSTVPELDCAGAMISASAAEENPGGAGSVALGAVDEAIMDDLFSNYATGDFHLDTGGVDAFIGVARWQSGDPPTDIDGDPRPTEDGTLDYAGADVP